MDALGLDPLEGSGTPLISYVFGGGHTGPVRRGVFRDPHHVVSGRHQLVVVAHDHDLLDAEPSHRLHQFHELRDVPGVEEHSRFVQDQRREGASPSIPSASSR